MRNFERNYRYRSSAVPPRTNSLPDLMTPAMPPLELVEAVRKHVHGMRHRRQLRKLLTFDDRALADIGYSRRGIQQSLHMRRQGGFGRDIGNIHQQDMHPERSRLRH